MAKRILIADDSVTIQKAFAMTFAGADDVTRVGGALRRRGAGARAAHHPDLMIADGVMPGRSGYDLCASIKADAGAARRPVLILASTQQPYDDAARSESWRRRPAHQAVGNQRDDGEGARRAAGRCRHARRRRRTRTLPARAGSCAAAPRTGPRPRCPPLPSTTTSTARSASTPAGTASRRFRARARRRRRPLPVPPARARSAARPCRPCRAGAAPRRGPPSPPPPGSRRRRGCGRR